MAVARDWNPPAAFPFARFEGGPRDVGLAHGKTFGDQVLGSIRVHRMILEKNGVSWSNALAWAEKGRTLMQLFEPKLAEELEGIADGVGVDRREIFAINFRVAISRVGTAMPIPETHECTTAAAIGAVTADGHTLLAQNWDQNSELQANLVVIEQRMPGQPALLFVTEAGRLFLHGMNDAGVGIVGNTLSCERPSSFERTAASGGRRRALRHTTMEAAHRSLIDTPHGTSGNHLLADKSGVAVDVEAIPDDAFSVLPEKGIIAHSNHFLHPKAKETLVDKILAQYPDTVHREARMRSVLTAKAGNITIKDVQDALRDHEHPPVNSVCLHPHPNAIGGTGHTLASTVMDLNDLRMFTAPGPACLGTYTEYRFS